MRWLEGRFIKSIRLEFIHHAAYAVNGITIRVRMQLAAIVTGIILRGIFIHPMFPRASSVNAGMGRHLKVSGTKYSASGIFAAPKQDKHAGSLRVIPRPNHTANS